MLSFASFLSARAALAICVIVGTGCIHTPIAVGDPAATSVVPSPGDAPSVTGAGNLRTRTVTWTPVLATQSVEVLDAQNAVVGTTPANPMNPGTVTIVLPNADASYDVRIKTVDAFAQETFSAITSVVLDRIAPVPGAAPTVTSTGAPNVTVRFTRVSDVAGAAVEVVRPGGTRGPDIPFGAGNSVSGSIGTDFGVFEIRVRVWDAVGNTAWTPDQHFEFTDDSEGGTDDPVDPPPEDDDPNGTTGGTGSNNGGGTGTGTGVVTPPVVTPPVVTPPVVTPSEWATFMRTCTGGQTSITVVTPGARKVAVSGVSSLATGTTLAIIDEGGTTVGSAVVGADGRFATSVAKPRKLTAKTAYRALANGVRTKAFAAVQPNSISSFTVKGSTVVVRGHIDVKTVGATPKFTVQGGRGADACTGSTALKINGKPKLNKKTGDYTLTVAAPTGSGRIVLKTTARGRVAKASGLLIAP